MQMKDILDLVNAGFTKDEILKMTSTEEKKPEEKKPEEKKPEEKKPDNVDALKAQIDELTKAIQGLNIAQSTGGKPEVSTIDDTLFNLLK